MPNPPENNPSFKLWAAGLVIVAVLGIACGIRQARDTTNQPPQQTNQEDCDRDDLHGPKPDPDCGGAWLSTPRPATRNRTPTRKTR